MFSLQRHLRGEVLARRVVMVDFCDSHSIWAMAVPSSANARLFYRAALQRTDDARFLFELNRTTAAVYLAGYSVECILKALVLASVPRSHESEVLETFRGARAHDYDWLLAQYAARGGAGRPPQVARHFARVNAWSTDLRYRPGTVKARDARGFLESVQAILDWADGRL